ncbi:methyltransferase domain-containing protein [Oceanirhabdus sp. W0125-5]|uniref:methyltransferase domain-containing protein n=1 Tax=Oceanirhabdus sp. W0125-5 TaxID=2999116 RepID=UPI0022F2AA88|nr:methyltransferase domain-containing protein [Oceanirhabdus sp. W0125-5]WBW97299.1 methyltransferase domain-containing protein [Oceanirhabdus sp. W0125-5]
MHKKHIDMLECPLCHGELIWDIKEESAQRIINAEIICSKCKGDYEVRDEIAVFLTPDLPRNDLWEKGESGLEKYFKENPDIYKEMMTTPEEELNGADYWYKAAYLEMKENYEGSSRMFKNAMEKIYTQEYIDGWKSQREFVIKNIDNDDHTIVDIASGKGYLVEEMIQDTNNYIIATDFSPTILERNREYFKIKGLYDRLSLIAFDARKTPFKNNSIEIMTSNLGIQNVENPGNVIDEMNRITKGKFMSVMQLIEEDDKIHMELMDKYSSTDYATKERAAVTFRRDNWNSEIQNSFIAEIKPTPKGKILEGAQIDGFPIQDTKVEYCVIVASK